MNKHVRGIALILMLALLAAPAEFHLSRSVGKENDSSARAPVAAGRITPATRRSIDRGTEWLISAMRIDGSLGTDRGRPPDLSCTAIFGLVLLSQGNTLVAGPNREELQRVLDATLAMVDRLPSGPAQANTVTLVQRKIGRNADLFVAALFLSQLQGEAGYAEKDVRLALEKLTAGICAAQQKDGTWGEESWAPVLGTVLGWECLRAASSSGLKVDASATAAGDALLKQLKEAPTHGDNWMFEFYKNASSIRVLYSMNYRRDPIFETSVEKIMKIAREDDRPFFQAGGEEFLAFYLVTECLLQERNERWQPWYPTVRDKIVRVQNADGSWTGHHCITARTFCTAAAMLTLQAANLYIPASDL